MQKAAAPQQPLAARSVRMRQILTSPLTLASSVFKSFSGRARSGGPLTLLSSSFLLFSLFSIINDIVPLCMAVSNTCDQYLHLCEVNLMVVFGCDYFDIYIIIR